MLVAGDLLAGALPPEPGHGFFQVTSKIISARRYYTHTGETQDIPKALDIANALYGEAGFAKNTAFTVNAVLYKYWSLEEQLISEGVGQYTHTAGQRARGVGDTEIGIRHTICQSPRLNASAGLKLGLPTSNFQSRETLEELSAPPGASQTEAPDVTILPGYHDYPASVEIHVGLRPVKTMPLDVSAQAGFKNRSLGPGSRGYSDVFYYGFQVAYPYRDIYLIFGAFGESPLENGDPKLDSRYLGFGPTIYWKVYRDLSITLGVESAKFNRNTLSALAYKGGVALSY